MIQNILILLYVLVRFIKKTGEAKGFLNFANNLSDTNLSTNLKSILMTGLEISVVKFTLVKASFN